MIQLLRPNGSFVIDHKTKAAHRCTAYIDFTLEPILLLLNLGENKIKNNKCVLYGSHNVVDEYQTFGIRGRVD